MDSYPLREEFEKEEGLNPWVQRAIDYGWTGQNLRLAMCLWRWGRQTQREDLMGKGFQIVEKWLAVALAAVRQGRPAPTRYLLKSKTWTATYQQAAGFARPTMETLHELALFCNRLRVAEQARPAWEAALLELLNWCTDPARRRAAGLLPLAWDEAGRPQPEARAATGGAPAIAALAEGSALPGQERLLERAEELFRAYAARFLEDCGHERRELHP